MTNDIQNKTIAALEEIWNRSLNSELSDQFFDSIDEPVAILNEKYGLNKIQSYIIGILIDEENEVDMKHICRHARCSNIRMMIYEKDFEDLCKRRMIRKVVVSSISDSKIGYKIEADFLDAIKKEITYIPEEPKDFSVEKTLEKIGELLTIIDDMPRQYGATIRDIRSLLADTTHLEFSKRLIALSLSDEELLMFLTASYFQIIGGHIGIDKSEYYGIISASRKKNQFMKSMNSGTNKLIVLNLLEIDTNNGMAMPNCFKLTEHAAKTVLAEFNYDAVNDQSTYYNNLIQPDKIKSKELYYNTREQGEIDRLGALLQQSALKGIQTRLLEANMRPGFTCLFYGAPGTGKTETVLQLSKLTGRPIMQVDVAELKSKWVGESEKRVQSLFEQYEKLVKKSDICPILLFNEADAIISKRTTNITQAVDKMENALQNIILQAMENLSGILIATTNLTENMDSAFERRFLYKIRFDKPEVSVRSKIWKSMLKDLSDTESYQLSKLYDFSGGQIENIARKQIIDNILYDNTGDYDSICRLCDVELIKNEKKEANKRPIGFL